MLRLFYALEIDADSMAALEQWRARVLPRWGRPVPAVNFHITLLFLGAVPHRTLARLLVETDRVVAPSMHLTLDTCGYFARPRIYWIGPGVTPPALGQLVKDLRRVVGQMADDRWQMTDGR